MRSFIAVEPKEEAVKRILEFRGALEKNGAVAGFTPEENLHCTLLFLGEKSRGELKEISEKIRGMGLRGFSGRIAGSGFFPGMERPRIFWLGIESEGLNEAGSRIAEELGSGEEKAGEFQAHITVARIRSREEAEALKEALKKTPVPKDFGEMDGKKIRVKTSLLSSGGPVYKDFSVIELK